MYGQVSHLKFTVSSLIFIATLAAAASAADAQNITLRINHGISGDSYEGRSMDAFAKRVGELTNGQATVRVFHNAALGDDEQAVAEVQAGTLDMEVTSNYENADTAGTVFDLPFLFADEAMWVRAVKGDAGKIVKDAANGKGFLILSFWMGGWRDVYGNRPINSMDDFKNLKIRTIQLKSYVQLFRKIGAIPTPIAFGEVYLALQQHTVDAAETDLQSMYAAKHYEVTTTVAMTNHGLSTEALMISEKVWNGLPQNVRGALEQAANDIADYDLKEYDAGNNKIQQLLHSKGLTITHPDTAPIRAIGKALYPSLLTDDAQRKVLQATLAVAP
jgi:tripartite ATP-independent transporter DctP family solute receptor